jgi:4-oxalomesaconate tautomerase
MRGGTSKGLYFHAGDLPADPAARDRFLLAVMGSPDLRQIDGVGGAHPLTSKVAVISRSAGRAADVDYLFLQVHVDEALVSDSQNCGNILAGVGPFAIEQGIVQANDGETVVRIRMLNSGGIAVATVQTPGCRVTYAGEARIDGVPGSGSPIMIDFADVAGSSCGALLPTGNAVDEVRSVEVTCIDSGMPVVILRATDFGLTGQETPAELEANAELKERLESIRLEAGPRMNLGDVREKTVPKMSLVAPPAAGGIVSTRTFIPHRVHQAIGVLGAASVAASCRIHGSVTAEVARLQNAAAAGLDIEHPTGHFTVDIEVVRQGGTWTVRRSALLRTARKLMEGTVFASVDTGAAP